MADYKVTDAQLSSIANAIRTKGETSAPLVFPSGFISAIESISVAGALGDISISSNGTYSAAGYGYDGFANVVVDVPSSDNRYDILMRIASGSIYDASVTMIPSQIASSNSKILGFEALNVTSIGESAFYMCSNMSVASFLSCTNVGYGAFNECKSLRNAYFPELTYAGSIAFRSCPLVSFNFDKLSSVGSQVFMYAFENDADVVLPAIRITVTSMFHIAKMSKITMPSCTKVTGAYVFSGTQRLKELVLPVATDIGLISNTVIETLRVPAALSFNANSLNFTTLRNIYLRDVSFISAGLSNKNYLTSVILSGSAVVPLSDVNAFNNTPMSNMSSKIGAWGSIYVPAELVDSYKAADNWSVFADRITAYVEE